MSLGQILRDRREELGLTLDEVSTRTGFSKPYLSTIETGKVKNPPGDTLLGKLEEVLGFERGLLQHIAHLERMPADVRKDFEAIDAQNRRYRQIIRNLFEDKESTDRFGSQLDEILGSDNMDSQDRGRQIKAGMLVPVINKVSAGYPMDFDDMGYPVGCSDDYVRCPDMHDANMFAVRVVGDSMAPKFREGDIVVFSPAAEVQNGDDCFVRLSEPHETTFKRVFFEQDGRIRLQPRNDRYGPMIVDGKKITGLYRAVIRYEKL